MHDRQPLFVRLSDGGVRNAYTLRVTNKTNDLMLLALSIEGLPEGATASIANQETDMLRLRPGQVASRRIFVTAPRGAAPKGQTPVAFALVDPETGVAMQSAESYFWGPK